MIGNNTKPFTCSYNHDGCEWALTLHAYDLEDAEDRCKKLGYLRLDGEIVAVIPARLGFLARFACWIRNHAAIEKRDKEKDGK